MPEQVAQSLHDRQTQPDSLGTIARRVASLVVLLEDQLAVGLIDADARVAHRDADILSALLDRDIDAAFFGVLHCIVEQVP